MSSGFQNTEANILFDEGAQRFFITEKLEKKLDLQILMNRRNMDLLKKSKTERIHVQVPKFITFPITSCGKNLHRIVRI